MKVATARWLVSTRFYFFILVSSRYYYSSLNRVNMAVSKAPGFLGKEMNYVIVNNLKI